MTACWSPRDRAGYLIRRTPTSESNFYTRGECIVPSFDIVNKVDLQEVDNALNNAKKQIATRYDFRGSKTEITFDKNTKVIRASTSDSSSNPAS